MLAQELPPVSLAVIGVAGYGESYLDTILNDQGARVRLAVAVDPRPQASKFFDRIRELGVPILPSIDALWSGPFTLPELIVLATPIHLHRPQLIESLAHGCHVLCEKPVAGDVSDALAMRDAADANADKVVAIGYQWSFSNAVLAAKRDILDGRFGAAKRFRALITMPRPTRYFARNRWAGRLRGSDGSAIFDSPANNAAAHHLHNMLFMGGDRLDRAAVPARVTAELARVNEIENYDTCAIRCQTTQGIEMLFYASHATTVAIGPTLQFEFERGIIRYDMTSKRISAVDAKGEHLDYGNPDAIEQRKLWTTAAAVRDPAQRPVPCGVDTALPHARVIAAVQRSASISTPPPGAAVIVEKSPLRYNTIRDLVPALTRCYDCGQLPSECGAIDWISPGIPIDLETF